LHQNIKIVTLWTIKKKNDRAINSSRESGIPKNQDELLWKQFVQTVSAHIDPVLASMLYATDLVQFDRARQIVEVVTLKKFVLFQDLFLEQKHVYQEYLNRLFGFQVILAVQFTKQDMSAAVKPRIAPTVSETAAPVVMAPRPQASDLVKTSSDTVAQASSRRLSAMADTTPSMVKKAPTPAPTAYYGKRLASQQVGPVAVNERTVDVSDIKKWKITHTLLQHFGGTVREIIKDTHEFDA